MKVGFMSVVHNEANAFKNDITRSFLPHLPFYCSHIASILLLSLTTKVAFESSGGEIHTGWRWTTKRFTRKRSRQRLAGHQENGMTIIGIIKSPEVVAQETDRSKDDGREEARMGIVKVVVTCAREADRQGVRWIAERRMPNE